MRIYRPPSPELVIGGGSPETAAEERQPQDQWVTEKTQPCFPQTSRSSPALAPQKDLEYSRALQGRNCVFLLFPWDDKRYR